MLFRCQRQAARRGEVCFFKLDHDMTDGAGHDAFLGAPEGLSGLAGSDAEPRLPSACHLLQGGGGDMPGIPGQACLADPQTGTLASGLHCCERKACDRCPVAVSRFRHLMHAMAAQPEGEGSRLCRGSRNGADEPFGSEGCKVHLFLFCSFLSYESIQLTRAETGAQTKSAGTGAGTCLICMKC